MVLVGYGLIGSACLRALCAAGFDVTGVGRDAGAIARMQDDAQWLQRDIATAKPADWARDLNGIDVVVNASGALQNGARDNLHAIHEGAIDALIKGIGRTPIRFVQISAAGAALDASTAFMATKGRGDAALMNAPFDWVILRPALVLGRATYGSAALLRASAATPVIGFSVLPDVPVQTVSLEDLTNAVVLAAQGQIAARTLADLTAPENHSFAEVTTAMRRWLGLTPWRATLPVPGFAFSMVAHLADALGWLGWRSPLRSTALKVLKGGI